MVNHAELVDMDVRNPRWCLLGNYTGKIGVYYVSRTTGFSVWWGDIPGMARAFRAML